MIIIHGENIEASRNKLEEVLRTRDNIKRVDGKSLTSDAVELLFDSSELFAVKKTVVIENPKALPKKTIEKLIEIAAHLQDELILWQNGNFDARTIKKFGNPTVFAYSLPKYYFSFLDSAAPQKGKELHRLYTKLLESFAAEQIFYGLHKRIRQLLIVQTGNERQLEEFAKMSPWQLNKLRTQARLWSKDSLKSFYQKLYALEVHMKTSNLPTNLENHIDILLLSEL